MAGRLHRFYARFAGPDRRPDVGTFLRAVWRALRRPFKRPRHRREIADWNVKVMGYELARSMAAALPPVTSTALPASAELTSKGCTQADIESAWFSYWAHRLKAAPVYHRKLWEFCFTLQALFEAGALAEGASAIGFGCGTEPLPSLFAGMGISVVATDAPAEIAGVGWVESGQHAKSLEALYRPDLCERPRFDRLVSLRHLDMNRIPRELDGLFNFVWSSCALEHLGNIANGLGFIEKSLACLKPGGVAVHTTEWNFIDNGDTVDSGPVVLFQRKHFEDIARRVSADGYRLAPLDFSLGSGVLDRFIDLPPYAWDTGNPLIRLIGDSEAHLKLVEGEFATTSFGLIVRKPG